MLDKSAFTLHAATGPIDGDLLERICRHEIGHIFSNCGNKNGFRFISITIKADALYSHTRHELPSLYTDEQLIALIDLKFGGIGNEIAHHGNQQGGTGDMLSIRSAAYTYVMRRIWGVKKIKLLALPSVLSADVESQMQKIITERKCAVVSHLQRPEIKKKTEELKIMLLEKRRQKEGGEVILLAVELESLLEEIDITEPSDEESSQGDANYHEEITYAFGLGDYQNWEHEKRQQPHGEGDKTKKMDGSSEAIVHRKITSLIGVVTHKIEEICRHSAPGDTIHQHYTLNLADGTFIDSSFSRSKDNGGLEVKIIRPIAQEKYALKSRPGDTVKQYYKLTDSDGKEIGSNFGEKSYSFMFGMHTVIERMDRVMTVMCFGEKLCVTIPGKFGDGGQKRDGIKSDQVLHYIVGLVYLFRPTPGPRWREKDGLEIEAVTHKIEEGACCRSALGDTIHQQYTLNLAEGGFIDSSFSRSKPFIFRLQHGQVIDGIDRVLTSGERRRVVIPAALGYGDQGRDIVPGGATLYFDIELHKLIKPRAD